MGELDWVKCVEILLRGELFQVWEWDSANRKQLGGTLKEMVPMGTKMLPLWQMGPIWLPLNWVALFWKMVPPLQISTPLLLCVWY